MTATDVRLLKDVHQICRIPLDRGGGVRACDLCDPYAVILLVDGTVAVVEVVEKGGGGDGEEGEEEATLQLTWPDIKKVGVFAAAVMYSMKFFSYICTKFSPKTNAFC